METHPKEYDDNGEQKEEIIWAIIYNRPLIPDQDPIWNLYEAIILIRLRLILVFFCGWLK